MLTDDELTQPSRIPLTEAITALAFGDPVAAPDIGRAIGDGRWGIVRQAVLDRITVAANAICDAGFAGKIECLGRKTGGIPGDADRDVEEFVTLTREDYHQYPRYVAGYDALWKKGKKENGEKPDEFTDTFAGLASEKCIGDIVIVRETFEAMWPASLSRSPAPAVKQGPVGGGGRMPRLSDHALKRWWKSLSDAERDLARDELHKRCDAAHPKNSIARQRIRDFGPKRNPGPRPITPDSSA